MLNKVKSERLVWLDTTITLLTLELMAYFYYGLNAVALAAVCVISSAAAEFLSLRLMNRRFTADDLTCTSDALITALMLPAAMDCKIAAIACIFAVVAAKNIFGGRINMIFSPAAAAYVFMMTSWKAQLLQFPEPHNHIAMFEKATGLVSSASHNFNISGRMDYTDFEILLGNFSGPAGAVSILLLIVAALMLIFRGDISAGAFVGTITGTVLLAIMAPMCDTKRDSVKYTLVTNMVLFAAIYIVSDRRIAPKHNYYAFFYGFFISAVSYILVLTTAKENAIVLVSVLFTPVALGFKNLEKKIDNALREAEQQENENKEDTENGENTEAITVTEGVVSDET